MPDSLLSWLIAALVLAVPCTFVVGVWYMVRALMGRGDVQVPHRQDGGRC